VPPAASGVRKVIERYDRVEGYCRKLGHHLGFGYCRKVNEGRPCPLARDCWYERFPVEDFLARHYSRAELEAPPPPGKLAALLSILTRLREGG
jgi:hypothetical protein